MAQNHVWRYTLRLFHTFAIFEQTQTKNCDERDPKSHVFGSESELLNRTFGAQGPFFHQKV